MNAVTSPLTMVITCLDVVGKTQIDPADAYHLINLGVEIPDIDVSLCGT